MHIGLPQSLVLGCIVAFGSASGTHAQSNPANSETSLAIDESPPREPVTRDPSDGVGDASESNALTHAAAGAMICGIGALYPEIIFGVAPVCVGAQLDLKFFEHVFVTGTFSGDAMFFRADPGYAFGRLATRIDVGWMTTGRWRFGIGGTATMGASLPLLALLILTGQFRGDFVPFLGPFADAQVGIVGKVEFDVVDQVTLFADVPLQAGVYLFFLPSLVAAPAVGVRFDLF